MKNIPKPNNSVALAMYLLFEAGLKGMTINDAIKSDFFFKFQSRVSDLILAHGVSIHKKSVVVGKDRWKNKVELVQYALYQADFQKNLEIYLKINGEPQRATAVDHVSEIVAQTPKAIKKQQSIQQQDLFQ